MVIHDLDIPCIPTLEPEAYAPLVIDANAVLAFAVTLQRFEPVAGRNPQVTQSRSAVQHQELSQRRLPEFGWRNPPASASYPETAGLGISKAADHMPDSNTQRY